MGVGVGVMVAVGGGGAIVAVAVAASIAASGSPPSGSDFLAEVLLHVPESITRSKIERAVEISPDQVYDAICELGTGKKVSAQDTVPFCLWVAAYHLEDYEKALWTTAKGMGDCDTTCAIVGGIVALSADGIPRNWWERREPLPWI